MDYQKSIEDLLQEAKAGISYKRLEKPYRTFAKIALFPLYIVEIAFIIAYYVQLFFYNALMSPVTYLEEWQNKSKDGIFHATQAVLFFVTTPFIFFLRVMLSLMSFSFFFLWFFLMCYTYLVTLGGIQWQPCINITKEKPENAPVLRAQAGEKLATMAFVSFVLFAVLAFLAICGVTSVLTVFAIVGVVYWLTIVFANAITCTTAREVVVEGEETTNKDKNDMFDNFVFTAVMWSIAGLFMFILALINTGIDLYHPIYTEDNGLAFIGTALMGIGVVMGLLKLVLPNSMGIGKAVVVNGKSVLAGILIGICFCGAAFGTVQYVRYLVQNNHIGGSHKESDEDRAIEIAKNSSDVSQKVRDDLGFTSTPSLSFYNENASEISSGSYYVTLNGTATGYDYYYDYVSFDFVAYVYVDVDGGWVTSVSVSIY